MQTQANNPAVPVAELEGFCLDALQACALTEADARTTTDVLVTTDTFGVFTQGTKALRGYCRRLRGGGLHADARPRVQSQSPAWAVVDGGSAIGMVTSVFAMNTAIDKARAAGIGYVGVRNSCHFGAAGYYTLLAAKADMIGLAMANDCPSMAVPGSRGPVLGTNPFSYALPAGEERPVFLDIASSAVAGGKIRIAQAEGRQVPLGWLVDAEGRPTTDPSVYPQRGSLLPFAGHKGYGFAVMIDALAGLLPGAGMTREVLGWIDSDPSKPTLHGGAFLAVNVAAMTPIDEFKRRMDTLIREIRRTPRAAGCDRIYLPGEMEWERLDRALREGIALPEDVRASLRDLAEDLQRPAPSWL